jgi:hypothetical protein
MNDLSNPTAREGALLAIKGLMANVGKAAEPYVVPLIQGILERVSDKVTPVRYVWLECKPSAFSSKYAPIVGKQETYMNAQQYSHATSQKTKTILPCN